MITDKVELIFGDNLNYNPTSKLDITPAPRLFDYRPMIRGKIGNHKIGYIFIHGCESKIERKFTQRYVPKCAKIFMPNNFSTHKIWIVDIHGIIINSGPVESAKGFTLRELVKLNYIGHLQLFY